jgi:hypothetical protein
MTQFEVEILTYEKSLNSIIARIMMTIEASDIGEAMMIASEQMNQSSCYKIVAVVNLEESSRRC